MQVLTEPVEESRGIRGRGRSVRRRIGRFIRDALTRARGKSRNLQPQVLKEWEHIAAGLLRCGCVSTGNQVKVFFEGDDLFDALWTDLDNAQHRIWFETYMIASDRVGKKTIEKLAAAAGRGCSVMLLYDDAGSSKLNAASLAPIINAGGKVRVFNPIWRWRRIHPLLRRDHRKIVVIDEQIGYCGGMNQTEEYAGTRYGINRFADCHLRLEGPAAHDLLRVSASSLRAASRMPYLRNLRSNNKHRGRKKDLMPCCLDPSMPPCLPAAMPSPVAGESDRCVVQVLASSGRIGRRAIQRTLRRAIRSAVSHCYITTPYFVPPVRLRRELTRAAKRGVEVSILTAGCCDVPIVHLAAEHIYRRLLEDGVTIHEMFDRTLHAKILMVDGIYLTIGSFNLDHWSDKRNLEVSVAVLDAGTAAAMEGQFQQSRQDARRRTLDELKQRSWWRRAGSAAAYHLMRS